MINIVTYSAALVIRRLLCFLLGLKRGQLFTEPEPFRLSAAAASGFIAGIYSVFGGGFTKASLVSALMLIALTPAATYLYGGLATRSDISGVRRDAGLLSAVFTAVLGLSAMSIAGFSPAFTASVFLTLCAAAAGGAFRGGVVGMGLRACLFRVALSSARDRRGDRRNSAPHRNCASDACLLRMRDGIFACGSGI